MRGKGRQSIGRANKLPSAGSRLQILAPARAQLGSNLNWNTIHVPTLVARTQILEQSPLLPRIRSKKNELNFDTLMWNTDIIPTELVLALYFFLGMIREIYTRNPNN